MSKTGHTNHVVSIRVIPVDTISFTSGTSCIFHNSYLAELKSNFEYLKRIKGTVMTWQQIMEKYNPFFIKEMKKQNTRIEFTTV